MSGPFQLLIKPQYVALDTSTWIELFKHRNDQEVKDIVDLLTSGSIIPYVSFEHVLELLQHSNQDVRLEQLDFFREIKLIACPKPISFPAPWRNSPICGSYMDVQEPEISALLKDPTLTLVEVIERVRPAAIEGVATGTDFANDSVLTDMASTGRAGSVSLNQAALSILYAALQNPTVIPRAGEYTTLDRQAAEKRKPEMVAALTHQFRMSGVQDPYRLADYVMHQSFDLIFQNDDTSTVDPFRELASKVLGLDLSRLPVNATQSDFVLETLFRCRMATHEKRMRLPDGAAYKALTRDQLSSLVAWFALDQAAKSNMPTAEGSNMIDFPLAAFALYIDKVQVDRRVLHQARMAANRNPFFERVYKNLFRTRDPKDLLDVLASL
jgi:hypothetical protein